MFARHQIHSGYAGIIVVSRCSSGLGKACALALPKTLLRGAAILARLGPPDDPSFSRWRFITRLQPASLVALGCGHDG